LGGRPENDASVVNPAHSYELKSSHEVNGRQGVCVENGSYWVSGSKTLAKYDSNWDLISVNDDPFKGYDIEVNHIGDIDVYNNELYIGAEYFMDGVGTNIQIAVYDGDTLERTFDDVTKQGEIEGLSFDRANGKLLLLYNRGARIVLGMPQGFYDGYDHEISEVFVYDIR
jgi:hypothetical protein